MQDEQKLEIHVPQIFDANRPAFTYTCNRYDICIGEHPLASRLPKPTNEPSIQIGATEFKSLACRPDGPKSLEDYLYSDEPQISLYITSFQDATLVSVTWPHTLTDAMGLQAIFHAWSLVLAGYEDQVPPFCGFGIDPLATLGKDDPKEPHILAKLQLKGGSMLLFVVRYIFELLRWRNEERRMICLPAEYLDSLMQEARSHLPSLDDSGSKPFISDGDVICAWWTRKAIQHMSPTSNRTIAIMNIFDLRSRLYDIFEGRAYIMNAILPTYTLLSASDILQQPLGLVALQIRHTLVKQTTDNQITALASVFRKSIESTRTPPLFGDYSNYLVTFTNWTKGKFFEINFSDAVLQQGDSTEKRPNKLGRPYYFHTFQTGSNPARNGFPIMGKDAAGNYWLGGTMRASLWPGIEKYMERK